MSDILWPHEPQHTRAPCPSPPPGVHPTPCPSSQWCHPTISSSVVPFSSHLPSFPASGSFQMSQFFTSGGQSIGVSASASVLPMNIQDSFPLWLTGWVSLQSKGLWRVFSNTTSTKASILQCSAFFIVQLSHPYMTIGKTIAITRWTFVGKVMSVFNMLSRLVIAFLPRSKHLLMAAVTICSDLEPKNMEKISFHSSPKERQCQRMLKLTHNCAHLTYYNVMFKILQARLQQYVNHELPDVQAGFRKCRGTRDQIANIHWIIEKAKEFQKNIYFCFINYARAFDCVDHNKL